MLGQHEMKPDRPLDIASLRKSLPGWEVFYQTRMTSTNDEARRLAREGTPDWTVVLTEEQTAGRGRRGARWVSPPGRNGIVSVLRRPGPGLPPEKWARFTLAAALAGCDALDAVPGLSATAEIKWPNDLYLSGRKVAGILVESAFAAKGGFVVIGTGFNLNLETSDFPEELRESATSVWLGRGGPWLDRTVFLTNYLQAMEARCVAAEEDFERLRKEAWRRSWLANRRVTLTSAGQIMEGIVFGLGPEGELLLKLDNGAVQVISSADLVRPVND